MFLHDADRNRTNFIILPVNHPRRFENTEGCVDRRTLQPQSLCHVLACQHDLLVGIHAGLQQVIHALDHFLRRVGVVDEVAVRSERIIIHQEHTLRGQTIAATSAGLLGILLNRLGSITMNDHSDVGFVDTQTECIRGKHHPGFIAHEPVLVRLPSIRWHTTMIHETPAGDLMRELGQQFLTALTRCAVHDRRPSVGFDVFEQNSIVAVILTGEL